MKGQDNACGAISPAMPLSRHNKHAAAHRAVRRDAEESLIEVTSGLVPATTWIWSLNVTTVDSAVVLWCARLLLTIAAICTPGFSYCRDGPVRTNILWVVSEDNTYEWIGYYGNKTARTPNIDALAQEGIVFRRAHST